MIKIHRIKCGNGNCYVLEENGNAVLVDINALWESRYGNTKCGKIEKLGNVPIYFGHGKPVCND